MTDSVTLPGTGASIETLDTAAGANKGQRQVISIAPRDLSAADSIGSLTETAPASDTASSGLNGRLQRIAQRITSLIALLPTALGTGGGLKIDGSGTALPVSGTITANAGTGNHAVIPGSTETAATGVTIGTSGVGYLGWLSTIAKLLSGTLTVASHAVTAVSGAFASGAFADGAVVTMGAKTDAKSTTTDGTSASGISIWKQISASVQALVAGVTLAAGTAVIGTVKTRFFAVAATAVTRPANTTAYTANDAVSNNATAASVTPLSFAVSDTNDDPISLERVRILTTDTGPGVALAQFRVWLYQSDPSTSTGIVGGDNAAFSTKQGTFLGTMSGNFKAFSDGSGAILVPDDGGRIITLPTGGAKTVFALIQTLSAFTPSANSTTFTATLEGFQGRA